MSNLDIIKKVTEALCNILESGTNPWIKPWKSLYNGKPNPRYMAYNYISKKPYRGINQLILPSGYYATFNQVKSLGGFVNKGAHSYIIVFFKFIESECEEGTYGAYERDGLWYVSKPYLRYDRVFNLEDTTVSFEYPTEDETETIGGVSKIEEVENAITDYLNRSSVKRYENKSDRAYYSPLEHAIHIPCIEQYETNAEYYSTELHELGHSTARFFNRECVEHFDGFGGQVYSREELVAEMTSAFCLGYFGIDTEGTRMNSTAYLKSWASNIRSNETLANRIIGATTDATKAFEMICNVKVEGGSED